MTSHFPSASAATRSDQVSAFRTILSGTAGLPPPALAAKARHESHRPVHLQVTLVHQSHLAAQAEEAGATWPARLLEWLREPGPPSFRPHSVQILALPDPRTRNSVTRVPLSIPLALAHLHGPAPAPVAETVQVVALANLPNRHPTAGPASSPPARIEPKIAAQQACTTVPHTLAGTPTSTQTLKLKLRPSTSLVLPPSMDIKAGPPIQPCCRLQLKK